MIVNSGKKFTNGGTVTANVTNSGTIENSKTLNITGGTNSGLISNSGTGVFTGLENASGSTITNTGSLSLSGGNNAGTIDGSGTTTITGDYSNSSDFTQSSIVVNSGKTLTNSGTLTGSLTNSGTVSNSKNLVLKGGTNSGTISGTGLTKIEENFINSGLLEEYGLTVNSGKKLTNTSAGDVRITTSFNNDGEISNTGSLTVSGSNNLGRISGSGTLNVSGDLIANKLIEQGLVNISAGHSLVNNAGITSDVTNSGSLDNNAILSGTLTNSGTASSSATNLKGNVSNSGTLTLDGGSYGNYQISGTGSTVISSDLTNNGTITQGTITLNSGTTLINTSGKTITTTSSFTNNGSVINEGRLNAGGLNNKSGSSISNSGTLGITGGTNAGTISGEGVTTLSGTVTNSGTITQSSLSNSGTLSNSGSINANVTNSGTLTNTSKITGNITNVTGGVITSVADNLSGDISNSGTLNLSGGKTQGSISGTGTLNVNGDLVVLDDISGNTLSLNSGSSTTLTDGTLSLGGLVANGGTLNAQNSKLDDINLGNVVLNDDLKISIDADLATKSADTISGSTLTTNGHYIIIDSINVLTDALDDMAFEVNVADSILRSSVKLSGDSLVVSGVKENINYLVSYSSGTGNLTFTYGDLDSALHLTASERNYTLGRDEIVTKDLGAMEDGLDVLSINGNNHKIVGGGHNGIIINDGNTLNVNNVSSMTGFNVALDNRADGKLNITNTSFTGNTKDILNSGELTFGGTNELNTLEGSGQTTVKNGQTTINVTLTQDAVTVESSGSLVLNGDSTLSTLTNSGNVKNTGDLVVDTLTNNKDSKLDNMNYLTVGAGNNAGTITGDGIMTVAGDFFNSGSLSQGEVVVNSDTTLTNSGIVTGSLTNRGTVSNSKDLIVTGGNNFGTISGVGTTTVSGEFSNSGTLTQGEVVVNSDKTLINSGSVTGSLTNRGTVSNSNALTLTGGDNFGTISGVGTTTVVEDFNNSGTLTQGKVVVNTDKTLTNSGIVTGSLTNRGTVSNSKDLTLTGGDNFGTISGVGTTTVVEDFNNSGTLTQGKVVVNTDKTLTNSGIVTGLLTNRGTVSNSNDLTVTAGENFGTITGSGTTTVSGDFVNSGDLSQKLVVNTNTTLTNSGTVNGNLTNRGTLSNNNALNLVGGDNFGTISGVGTTTVVEDFNNEGTLTQDEVVVNANKTLTNSGEVTGALTNRGTVSNSNALNLVGGDNFGTISGTGTTTVVEDFNNEGTLTQGEVVVNANKTLTNSGSVTGSLTNRGTVSNNNALTVTGGENFGTISGSGTTTVSGDFVNSGDLSQKLLVNTDTTLTNSGTVNGNLTNRGTVSNSNALNLVGGDNFGTISGVGTTTVVEDFNNEGTLTQDEVVVNANKTLTNSGEVTGSLTNRGTVSNSKDLTVTGGDNFGTISGSGTTTVSGDFVNSGDLSQKLLVNAEASLTNSGTVTGSLTNRGTVSNNKTLTLTGGENVGTINGVGTTTLVEDFSNSGTLTQGSIVVNTDNTLTNSGSVTGDLTNRGTVSNSNTLNLAGGSNFGTISGSGTTTFVEDFSNSGTLTQGELIVNSDKTLTNSGDLTGRLTNRGTVSNSKTLTLKGGENIGTIDGLGTLSVSDKFTNSGNITQTSITNSGTLVNNGMLTGSIINIGSGILTSSATNLVGTVSNSGTLNLNGGKTQGSIIGTNGLINLSDTLVVSHEISGNTLSMSNGSSMNILSGGSLDLLGLVGNGSSINTVNDTFDLVNLGDVVLNDNLSLSLDANLDSDWTDIFTSNSFHSTNDSSILINNLHILGDANDRMPLSFQIVDGSLRENVLLGSTFTVTSDIPLQDNYLINYDKSSGSLKFSYSNLYSAINADTSEKGYLLGRDEHLSSEGLDFKGNISISGGGHSIIGDGGDGPVIGEDQSFSMNDLTYTGFNTGITNNGGTLNLTDTTFEYNEKDISNDSEMNLSGKTSFTTVDGNGAATVTSKVLPNGEKSGSLVTLKDGGSFTQDSLTIELGNEFVNNGHVTLSTLTNDGVFTNNEDLSVSSGTNTGSIVGSGDIDISGKFTSSGVIDQHKVQVFEGADFTVNLEKVQTSDNTLLNDGTIHATDGKNSLKIEGDGDFDVVGDLTNFGTIKQHSVNVSEGGKLTASLDDLLTDIISTSGELHISDNKINKDITGTSTGSVHIDHSLSLDSKIIGTGVTINSGTVVFGPNADLSSSTNFTVNGGSLNLVNNNPTENINLGQLMTMNKDLGLLLDVDLSSKTMDRISADNLVGDGFINVQYMNLLSDGKENKTRVPFANEALKNNVKTEVKTLAYSPIWFYGVDYDKTSGEFLFTKGGNGAGNGYQSFNPAVLSSPVATQISGHLTMSHTISEAFGHSDWYFRLPRMDRFARMNGNSYAILPTDYNGNLGPSYANEGIWSRPYSTFESVSLGGGPKVNIMSYGTMAGGDSDFRRLRNGWAYVASAYVGYNGSQYSYSGVSTTSNGGILGMTSTFYKGNFYTALTATAGAGFAETHNMYGKEDITMLMGGIASKSGYNLEFNEGRFIIQPNLLMSYSFVGTFNYNNSAGVRIDNDPMHTIQLNPSLRFIGNTRGGWQPYATLGMVWNIMNETHSVANGIRLPEMSTRPYIEYGLGLQKLWDDKFSAYVQALVRNGGRTGVSLSAGFKWSLGKDEVQKVETTSPVKSVNRVEAPVSSLRTMDLTDSLHVTPFDNVAPVHNESPSARKVIKQLSPVELHKLGVSGTRVLDRGVGGTTLTSGSGVLKE